MPITHVGWDYLNKAKDFIFYRVHFTREFGPWHDKEFCAEIHFLLSEGRIEEYNAQGGLIKKCNIGIHPIVEQPKVVSPPVIIDNHANAMEGISESEMQAQMGV